MKTHRKIRVVWAGLLAIAALVPRVANARVGPLDERVIKVVDLHAPNNPTQTATFWIKKNSKKLSKVVLPDKNRTIVINLPASNGPTQTVTIFLAPLSRESKQ